MKEFLQIEGNNFLSGEVSISGAKNSAVAVIPISLLAKDIVTLTNIPKIDDVYSLIEILNYINVKTEFIDNQLIIDSRQIEYKDLTIEQISHLRASYYFISVFLGLFKKIKISQFGGCKIGDRPIDIHINGLKKLNINFKEIDQDYYFDCNEIKSAVFKLPFPSVGATINLMVAALSAKGIVKLSNCAQEPEIVDVAKFINAMGGKIIGAGTKTIIIDGGRHLHGCSHQIIPDRIEAGTYAIIAAANAEQVKIKNIRTDHLNNLLDIFIQIGINFHAYQDNLIIKKTKNFKPIDLEISNNKKNTGNHVNDTKEENQDLDRNAFPTLSQSKDSVQSKKIKANGVKVKKEDAEDEQLVEDLKQISLLENKLTETIHKKTNIPLSTEQAKTLSTILTELDNPIIEYLAGLLPFAGKSKNQIKVISSKHMYEILGDHLLSFDVVETEEEAEKKCKIIYNELKKNNLVSNDIVENNKEEERIKKRRNSAEKENNDVPVAGSTCMAKYRADGLWYRATIDEVLGEGSNKGYALIVTFSDYNDKQEVFRDEVRQIILPLPTSPVKKKNDDDDDEHKEPKLLNAPITIAAQHKYEIYNPLIVGNHKKKNNH